MLSDSRSSQQIQVALAWVPVLGSLLWQGLIATEPAAAAQPPCERVPQVSIASSWVNDTQPLPRRVLCPALLSPTVAASGVPSGHAPTAVLTWAWAGDGQPPLRARRLPVTVTAVRVDPPPVGGRPAQPDIAWWESTTGWLRPGSRIAATSRPTASPSVTRTATLALRSWETTDPAPPRARMLPVAVTAVPVDPPPVGRPHAQPDPSWWTADPPVPPRRLATIVVDAGQVSHAGAQDVVRQSWESAAVAPIIARRLPVDVTAVRVDDPVGRPRWQSVDASWWDQPAPIGPARRLVPIASADAPPARDHRGRLATLAAWDVDPVVEIASCWHVPATVEATPYAREWWTPVAVAWDVPPVLPMPRRQLPPAVLAVPVDAPVGRLSAAWLSSPAWWPDTTWAAPRLRTLPIGTPLADQPRPSRAQQVDASWWEGAPHPRTQRRITPETPPVVDTVPIRRHDVATFAAWEPVPPAIQQPRRLPVAATAVPVDAPVGTPHAQPSATWWDAPEWPRPRRVAPPETPATADAPPPRTSRQTTLVDAWRDAGIVPPRLRLLPAALLAVPVDAPVGRAYLWAITASWLEGAPVPTQPRPRTPQAGVTQPDAQAGHDRATGAAIAAWWSAGEWIAPPRRPIAAVLAADTEAPAPRPAAWLATVLTTWQMESSALLPRRLPPPGDETRVPGAPVARLAAIRRSWDEGDTVGLIPARRLPVTVTSVPEDRPGPRDRRAILTPVLVWSSTATDRDALAPIVGRRLTMFYVAMGAIDRYTFSSEDGRVEWSATEWRAPWSAADDRLLWRFDDEG